MNANSVVFLDRDGVINELVMRDTLMVSPRLFSEFKVCDGAAEAIESLLHKGFEIVVVTNQPDISRKNMLQIELDKMTAALLAMGIHKVVICPHSDDDFCKCRKPKPGMLKDHLAARNVDPQKVWMIGDRESDIAAGKSVGAKTIYLSATSEHNKIDADYYCKSLIRAVEIILHET
jgi:D-glycero-D-manno-heptose 1,7-bisphosphate phosphatase